MPKQKSPRKPAAPEIKTKPKPLSPAAPIPSPPPSSAEASPLRLEWRTPDELDDNPANWRQHPEAQLAALSDVLDEVGWAGACLYNERTGRLIDGHARKQLALTRPDGPSQRIPVLVGSWDEATERKILITLDPLATMATAGQKELDALLHGVEAGSTAIQEMLAKLAKDNGLYPEADQKQGNRDVAFTAADPPAIPERFEILITCADEETQKTLLERLIDEGLTCRALIC